MHTDDRVCSVLTEECPASAAPHAADMTDRTCVSLTMQAATFSTR